MIDITREATAMQKVSTLQSLDWVFSFLPPKVFSRRLSMETVAIKKYRYDTIDKCLREPKTVWQTHFFPFLGQDTISRNGQSGESVVFC